MATKRPNNSVSTDITYCLQSGDIVAGRFKVLSALGKGGLGEVYQVADLREGGQEKALKLLSAWRKPESKLIKKIRAQLKSEFWMLKQVQHEGIVQGYEFGICSLYGDYIVMEFMHWETLERAALYLNFEQIVKVLYDMSLVLTFVHRLNIIHRDLKPNNVFIDIFALDEDPLSDRLTLKIADFGLAIKGDDKNTKDIYGSFAYIAPELLLDGISDARNDIYSLGMIGLVLLTRKNPFNDESVNLFDKKKIFLPNPQIWGEVVPDALSSLLTRCLNPNPDMRPQTMAEVNSELGRLVNHHVPEKKLIASMPFVGRNSELRYMGSLIPRVKSGEHLICFINGPVGVGKSRLMEENSLRQQARGIEIIKLTADNIQPLKEFCIQVIRQSPKADQATVFFDWKSILLSAMANFGQRCLLVNWHDFNKASADTIKIIKNLIITRTDLPILWLLEIDQEIDEFNALGYNDNVIRRKLNELDSDSLQELVGSLLGYAKGYNTLSKRLISIIGSRPALIQLALQGLISQEIITFSDGYWQITDPNVSGWRRDFNNLNDFIKIEMTPSARSVVEFLAAVDKPCEVEELRALLEIDPVKWGEILREIAENGIAEVIGNKLTFKQQIIQELVYRSVTPENRRRLHSWVATWLEEQLPILPDLRELIYVAYHYDIAGATPDFLRVMRKLVRFIQKPEDIEKIEIELLWRAIQESRNRWLVEERYHSYELLANLFTIRKRYDEAARVFQELLNAKEFTGILDDAKAHLGLGKSLLMSNRLDEALEPLLYAYKSYERNDLDYAGKAIQSISYIYFRNGDIDQSWHYLKKYHELIENLPNIKISRRHWISCAGLYRLHKKYNSADECYKKIIDNDHIQALDDNIAMAYISLLKFQIQRGEHKKVLETLEKLSRQSSLLLTNRAWEIIQIKAISLFSVGEIQQGLSLINSEQARIKLSASAADQCRLMLNLMKIDFYSGAYYRGINRIRKAITIARRAKYYWAMPMIYAWLVRFRWMAGKSTEKALKLTDKVNNENTQFSSHAPTIMLLADHALLIKDYKRASDLSYFLLKSVKKSEVEIPYPLIKVMQSLVKINCKSEEELNIIDQTVLDKWDDKTTELADLYQKGMYLYWLFQIAYQTKQYDRADDYYKHAISVFRQTNSHIMIAELMNAYSEMKYAQNDQQNGFSLFQQSRELLHSLGLIERVKKMDLKEQPKQDLYQESGVNLPLGDLANLIEMLNTMEDPEELTKRFLELAMRGIGAKRGLILLKRQKTEGLSTRAAVQIGEVEEQSISISLADIVFKQGEPIFSENAIQDSVLGSLDSVRIGNIRSVACLPIKHQREVIGIIYLDFRSSLRRFTEPEKNYLLMIAHLIGIISTQRKQIIELKDGVRELRRKIDEQEGYRDIKGKSKEMQDVYQRLELIKDSEVPVLIIGESGTGKELIARTIQRDSKRAERPFYSINCIAFPEHLIESMLFGHCKGAFTGANSDHSGFFEQANDGTIFMDELEETSWAMQGKLLRVLQEGEFFRVGETELRKTDVRIIAAAKPSLLAKVESGAFRQDLFYRLNVVQITVPPLRQRVEDIALLTDHFFNQFSKSYRKELSGIDPVVIWLLQQNPWTGNVRQLENAIRHAVLFAPSGSVIRSNHLPQEFQISESNDDDNLAARMAMVEKRLVFEALQRNDWDRTAAAKQLGISSGSLYRKIASYDLKQPDDIREERKNILN